MNERALKQSELAGIMRVTARTVRNWTDEGLPRRKDGCYSLRASIRWYVARRQAGADLDAEQTRLYKERADALASANAERRAQLAEPAIARAEWERFAAQIRRALLAFPAKVNPLLTGNVIGRKAVLEDAVRETLSCLVTDSRISTSRRI